VPDQLKSLSLGAEISTTVSMAHCKKDLKQESTPRVRRLEDVTCSLVNVSTRSTLSSSSKSKWSTSGHMVSPSSAARPPLTFLRRSFLSWGQQDDRNTSRGRTRSCCSRTIERLSSVNPPNHVGAPGSGRTSGQCWKQMPLSLRAIDLALRQRGRVRQSRAPPCAVMASPRTKSAQP
jgi:hypothetical protein